MSRMRVADLFLPIRVIAFALIIISIAFGVSSLRMSIWATGMPGPGLTPLLASACLLPLAISILLTPLTEAQKEPLRMAPFAAGALLLAFIALMNYVGFVLPAIVFCIVWSWLVYRRRLVVALSAGLLMPLAMYVVFILGLRIPLVLWPE